MPHERSASPRDAAGRSGPDFPGCLGRVNRRQLLSGLAGAAGLALAGCGGALQGSDPDARTPRLRLIGEVRVPHRLAVAGTPVGGLSGLDYDPAGDLWYALSDDRSELAPARFYTFRLPITLDRLDAPAWLGVGTLLDPQGVPFPPRRLAGTPPEAALVVDPESIRWRADTRTLLWTSEGDGRLAQGPFLRECAEDGRHLRGLELPANLNVEPGGQRGARDNLTLEGLTLSRDGRSAWVAMEAALVQDGPLPTATAAGGPCRLTRVDLATGRAVQQVAYRPDPIPAQPQPPGGFADNGISEILAWDDRRLLVLERAFVTGVGNSLRLYLIDPATGSDTLNLDTLTAANHRPVDKHPVLDFASLGLPRLDNTEGLAWGPQLSNGRRSLVCVSDDNFNPGQITQFLAFECIE